MVLISIAYNKQQQAASNAARWTALTARSSWEIMYGNCRVEHSYTVHLLQQDCLRS